ncbi:MAG: TonB-dependent receptor [Proteobacteria bacterium]|nr:TonB-dependent receptor [Pseudomonadota bacterium]
MWLVSTAIISGLGALATATPAWAEDQPAAAQAQADDATAAKQGQVSDIIVTATRREESAQRVPVAITALSAADLQARGIQNTDDLKFQVPGLQIYSSQVGVTNYTIRGLGNANNRSATADGSVGVFVNEAYIGRPFLVNTDFIDMERVEVLRGPQGTLFGRNTIGGAISFYSTKPGPATRAGGEVTVGNYNQRDAGGFISGEIADNVYAKVAVTTRNHDGYNFNTTTNTAIEDQRMTGVSAALRFTPTSDLDITLNVDTTIQRGTGSWWIDWVRGPYSGAPYANPRIGNGADDNGFGNINNSGGSLNVSWHTPIGDLTSVTAYRYGKLDSRSPSTGTEPAPPGPPDEYGPLSGILFTQEDDYRTRQYSQELRLASNNESAFRWLLGAYYYHEKSYHTAIVDYQFNNYYGYSGRARYDSTGTTDAFALFGNVSYNITDKLKLQAGLRWSNDHKEFTETPSGQSYGAGFTVNGDQVDTFNAAGKKTFRAATPSFTVNYQATPSVFLYATVSQGFKSGGFNDVSDEKAAAETPYLPEKVWNYEAGFKADLLDHHARLNVSVFRLDYTNLQVSEVIPAYKNGPNIIVTANAGKTHNQGVEAEFQLNPVRGLQFYGNFSYQDSNVDQLRMVVDDVVVDQSGHKLPLVPKTKWMLGGAYTFPIGGEIDTTLRGAYSRTASYYGYITNNPLELVPPQSNLTASLLFEPRGSHWNVELWGKNLEDKLNISQLFQIFGASYAKVGVPRTWGLTVRYKY